MNGEKRSQDQNNGHGFVDFKASFERQNLYLKITGLMMIIMLVWILFLVLSYKKVYFTKNSEAFRSEVEIEEVCYWGFKSIVKQSYPESLFDAVLIKSLKTFSEGIKGEKVYFPKMLDKTTCRIIIKDTIGLRAFNAKMVTNNDWIFTHKIFDIDEIEVGDKEKEVEKIEEAEKTEMKKGMKK